MFNVIFVLFLNGAVWGTVGVAGAPVDQAMCEKITTDPENIEFVQNHIAEQTGVIVDVTGICMPYGDSE